MKTLQTILGQHRGVSLLAAAISMGLVLWLAASLLPAGHANAGRKKESAETINASLAETATAAPGQVTGDPWTGDKGISETTEEIMGREAVHTPRKREADPKPSRIRPDRGNLPQNPDATLDTQWPAAAEAMTEQETEALNKLRAVAAQTPGLSFTGATLSETSSFPPDTMGDVGPTQYLVGVNGRIKVFDKATGTLGALNADLDVFFQSVRGSTFTSDPRVRFDRLSGRWYVIMINVDSANNRIVLAVSNNATITATTVWTFFQFVNSAVTPTGDTGCFADYPTLGIDANALYIGVNNFCPNTYAGTSAFVVRKSSITGAGPIVVTAFRNLTGTPNGPGIYTPQGVDNIDPAATEGYFIGVDNIALGTLVVRRVSNPGGVPTISPNIFIPVLATSIPRTVPHLGNNNGTTGYLDAIDDRLFAATIRNGRLWTAHNISVTNTGSVEGARTRNAVRWYELKDVGTDAPNLVQAGTLFAATANNSPDDRNYWMPSVMVSGQGHAALGFSTAGATEYINAATAGRLAGDLLGTLRDPALYTNSQTAYNPPNNTGSTRGARRWGDYSYTSVDPTDDMTMWTIQQFCDATNSYGVRVVKLIAPPPATIAGVNPPSVAVGQASTNVTITGLPVNGAGFYDPGAGFAGRLRASISGDVTVNSVTYVNPTTITLNISTAAAAAGAKNITITNPDGQSVTAANVLTVGQCSYTAAPTTQSVAAAGGTGTVTVTTTAECGWTAASNVPWISVTAGTPGSGNGTVSYTVAANIASAPRTGTLTIAGQTVTVTQAEGPGCVFALDPATATYSSEGGSGTIRVTTPTECAWTATTTDPFIRLITTGSGAGNSTVNYTVASSSSPVPRTGRINIGGATFIINQDGAPYEIAIDDGTFEIGYRLGDGGTGTGVNRLTPEVYPSTIKEVSFYLRTASQLRVGDPITIVVGANADGDANINGTTFQAVNSTVQRLDGINIVPVPNLTINSGDFVVGLRMPMTTSTFPYALDTGSAKRRSYYSLDGTNFSLFDSIATTPGNFSFRARLVRPPKLILKAGTKLEAETCGVGNGAIDPAEQVTVSFSLLNNGSEATSNLTATLLATGGVTAPGPAQAYGAIAPGAAAVTRSFTFTASPTATCGGTLTATLKLQDGATDLGTVNFDYTLGGVTSFSVTETFAYTGAAVSLPDLQTVEIPITVPATGNVSDVNVRVRLNHSFNSDVDMFLVAPDGTVVELATDLSGANYGSGTNDCAGVPTVFDDQATTAITAASSPFAGTFRPEGKLSDFNGKQITGIWKLRITDDLGGDSGTLGCFQVEISRRVPLCCREGCPSVSRIAPDRGPAGTQVTITGVGFTGVTGVKFTNNLPASFKVDSDTQITTIVPVGVATGVVSITKPDCGEIPAAVFTAPLCPTFGSLDPPSGVIGSQIRINGNNLTGVTSVKFANNVTAQFTVTSNNIITATVPAGAITGPITLGKPDCADVATSTFTVTPCPSVTALSPSAGQVGSTLLINGVGFTGVTAVRFNNNSVSATFTINSDTQITATVPTGATTGAITLVKTPCPNAASPVFTVQPPPPTPISMTPSMQTISLGSTGAITIVVPPQSSATNVTITSSNSAVVFAPVTVSIPSNASTATFSVTGNGIGGPVTITATMPASLGGLSATATVSVTQRTIRASGANASPGGTVTIPIELLAQGDENAIGFSLGFDPAILSNPRVALGGDAAAASLSTNLTLASQGRAGIALALPAGQKFAAGTRQIASVTFTAAANVTLLSTQVSFSDQPIQREVTDANANGMAAVFLPGFVSFNSGFEGDVSPRPFGNNNGVIALADWVQIGRFVAGLDKPENGSEFQRADNAPRETRGDGRLTVLDWTQASRYASGLDPVAPAGGPSTPASTFAQQPSSRSTNRTAAARTFRSVIETGAAGTRTVRLELDARGNEHALGFSLSFNPSHWRFVSASAGADALDATVLINSAQAAQGRIGVALSLTGGRAFKPGARELVTLTFVEIADNEGLQLNFGDFPVSREVVDADARLVTTRLLLELVTGNRR
ncbi:MAG: proprotein convertase P-domain-containing protein [Blastocatellia bacterium]|nr:proprotein convertase P-domain-containing protein [Blastocatellia bacterium]